MRLPELIQQRPRSAPHNTPEIRTSLPPIHRDRLHVRDPKLKTVGLRAMGNGELGLTGTQLAGSKSMTDLPVLPKLGEGPAHIPGERQFGERDWRRLGGLLRGARSFARQTVDLPDNMPVKEPETGRTSVPAYRSMMMMDIQMMKNTKPLSEEGGESEGIACSLDELLSGLTERHSGKNTLPPLTVQWGSEHDKADEYEDDADEEEERMTPTSQVLSRKSVRSKRRSAKSRKTPYGTPPSSRIPSSKTSHAPSVAPSIASSHVPSVALSHRTNKTSKHSKQGSPQPSLGRSRLETNTFTPLPFSKPDSIPSPSKKNSEKSVNSVNSGESVKEVVPSPIKSNGEGVQHPVKSKGEGSLTPSMFSGADKGGMWSPHSPDTDSELHHLTADMDNINVDVDYLEHIANIRKMMEQDNAPSPPKSVPAVYVDEDEQVYVGEVYGDTMGQPSLNPTQPFDYMAFVKDLNRKSDMGGPLTLQQQSLGGGGGMPQGPLKPGLYVMRSGPHAAVPHMQDAGPRPGEGLGGLGIGDSTQKAFTETGPRYQRHARSRSGRTPQPPRQTGSLDFAPGSQKIEDGVSQRQQEQPKGQYLLRPTAEQDPCPTPDQRFPKHVLHQPKESTYVQHETRDPSFLAIPKKPPKIISSSSKSSDSGYVLKKGIPLSSRRGADRSGHIMSGNERMNEIMETFSGKDKPPVVYLPLDDKTKKTLKAMKSGKDLSDENAEYLDQVEKLKDYMDHLEKTRKMLQFMEDEQCLEDIDEVQELFPDQQKPTIDDKMKKTIMALESGKDVSGVDTEYLKRAKTLKNIVLDKSKDYIDPAKKGKKVIKFMEDEKNLESLENMDKVKELFPDEETKIDDKMKAIIMNLLEGKDMKDEDPKHLARAKTLKKIIVEQSKDYIDPVEKTKKMEQVMDDEDNLESLKDLDEVKDLFPDGEPIIDDKMKRTILALESGEDLAEEDPIHLERAKSLQKIVVEKVRTIEDDDSDAGEVDLFADTKINFGHPIDDKMIEVLDALYSGSIDFLDDIDPEYLKEAKEIKIIIRHREQSPTSETKYSPYSKETPNLGIGISFLGGRPDQQIIGQLPTPPPSPPPSSPAILALEVNWQPRKGRSAMGQYDDEKHSSSGPRESREKRGSISALGNFGDLISEEFDDQSDQPQFTFDVASEDGREGGLSAYPSSRGSRRSLRSRSATMRVSSARLNTPRQPQIAMFGSTEAATPISMMDGRYVINPGVSFPDSPRQDQVHYDYIKLDDRHSIDPSGNFLRAMAARKLPRHLMFRSHVHTPQMIHTPNRRPLSANDDRNAFIIPCDLAQALESLKDLQLPHIDPPSGGSSTGIFDRESDNDAGHSSGELQTPGDLTNIVKIRTELVDNFRPREDDMFSDITDSERVTPMIRDRESDMAIEVQATLHGIPEEEEGRGKQLEGKLDGSHAGVYLTELLRGGKWVNEDIPVYVTPDGKVFISSVIINQPICEVDKIQFSGQDDADNVHNKPEEGSLTFSGGKLEGWVKFPGQEAVKIKGCRWDPRQTGHYVLESKKGDKWEPLPLQLDIMLGGKVTVNDVPVHNPAFDGNNVKLNIRDRIEGAPNHFVATFDPHCMELSGVLTNKPKTQRTEPNVTGEGEVEIRGHKWDPSVAGHYYCQQGTESGWKSIDLQVEISDCGLVTMDKHELGLPKYSGNEMELFQIDEPDLPDRVAVAFGNGRFTGTMEVDGKVEDLRGVRWDPSMVGNYSTQELIDNTWVNKGMVLSIDNNANVAVQSNKLDTGFIVDNKVFIRSGGGLDDFFKNSGPVSDATLAGQSFLMQRDSPTRTPATSPLQEIIIHRSSSCEESQIKDAEIVFSSNRCYGHITEKCDEDFREIRGYKWDPSIAGEYFTEILKPDGKWKSGPTIKVTPDGSVTVDKADAMDVLLKDNIISINDVPGTEPMKHCLVAIQDNILNGWIQNHPDAQKAQIRGSIWKEGPGASGAYITNEKKEGDWYSSTRAVCVSPANTVRITDMNLEGEMDGQIAKLFAISSNNSECGELVFDEETFAGWVKEKENTTELKGYKFDGLVPGVYLLEYKDSNDNWAGLDTQLIVTENGNITLGGTAVKNVKPLDGTSISFEHDKVLDNVVFSFIDGGVLGTGKLCDVNKVPGGEQTEIRGLPWHPKIAGKYETEIFTGDSGWKPAKNLEITLQGKVLYGGVPATGVRLDTDTMSFDKGGNLEDVTLSFDNTGFTGNVITSKDKKSRVMRGKRVGTRPVSALSGTALSLGNEEEDNFEELNGQIGSKINTDGVKGDGAPGHGITSDYGSASDVVTQQLSGSRTEALSSSSHDDQATSQVSQKSNEEVDGGKEGISLNDIGLEEMEDSPGIQFESWPPPSGESQGDIVAEQKEEEDEGVKIDVLPRGLSPLGVTEVKDSSMDGAQDKTNDMDNLPNIPNKSSSSLSNRSSKSKRDSVDSATKRKSVSPNKSDEGSDSKRSTPPTQSINGKNTRTPLPEIPQRTLQQPALTRSVKLPGIDIKEKGAAAEITDDTAVLQNYMEKKAKKGGKKKVIKKKKKTKQTTDDVDDFKKVRELTKNAPDREENSLSPSNNIEERTQSGIDKAKQRRSNSSASKTPLMMADIDRDTSRDVTPEFTTPTSLGGSSTSSMPKREFQGALMAAKKIKEFSSSPTDSKKGRGDDIDIPADVREYPVAEDVAEKFGMEMRVKEADEQDSKLTAKERRELARQKKKDEAERKRRERDEEKRRQKDEEERKLLEEAQMAEKRKQREEELARARERELQRRRDEEAKRKQARLDERDKKKREEDKMLDAKKRLEEELKRRREAEAARLAEIERQKQLALEKERENEAKRFAEAEALRAEMEKEMAKELAEYERKVREEEERQRLEDALKAEAERRLLDVEERKRIIALARHLWNKGVRVEGKNLDQELEISSIFYSYFNYLHAEQGYDPEIDFSMDEKMAQSKRSSDT